MAEEEQKEAEEKTEEKPAEDKAKGPEGGEAAPEEGAPKKGGLLVYAGVGGGAAAIIAMAFFLTQAAVQTPVKASEIVAQALGKAKPEQDPEKIVEQANEHSEQKSPEGEGEGQEGKVAAGENEPKLIEFPEIRVNPSGANNARFCLAKIGVIIDSEDPAAVAQGLGEGSVQGARVLHEINMLLRRKTVEELSGDANLKLITEDIKNIVERLAFQKIKGKVLEVTLLEFLVQ